VGQGKAQAADSISLMTDHLIGCRAKIERAKKDVGDLQIAVEAFFKTNPYVIGTKRDPNTRRLLYHLTSVKDTPPMLAVITGDILHDLRSVLDHLAHQLVCIGMGNPGPFPWVYFPAAFNSAQEYESGKNAQIHGMRGDAVKAIDAIEPYKGGKGDMIWRLHHLNRIDKHRLLITVGSAYRSLDVGAVVGKLLTRTFPDKPTPAVPLFLRPKDRMFPLKAGDVLFEDLPDAEVNKNLQFRFDVALSEPQIVEGDSLLETVHQMTNLVDNLIPVFEPLLK
jgi:hypothetical protein